jgi:hypothetical protein
MISIEEISKSKSSRESSERGSMAVRIAWWLLVALASVPASAFLRYVDPVTQQSLTACVCLKCGSSSIYKALYLSITGREFQPSSEDSVYVQRYTGWNVSSVRDSHRPGDVHVNVVRDPVDRQLSAYNTRAKCCARSTKPCNDDESQISALSLARFVGNWSHPACFHEEEFARSMFCAYRRIDGPHAQGAVLERHFRPQHHFCPLSPAGHVTLQGTASELAPQLAQLQGFRFRGGPITVQHANRKPRDFVPSTATLQLLCAATRAEYRALSLPQPERCRTIPPLQTQSQCRIRGK